MAACFRAPLLVLLLTGCGEPSKSDEAPPTSPPPTSSPSLSPEARAPSQETAQTRRHRANAPLPPDPVPNLPPDSAKELFERGDRLAKQKKYAEALSWWRWGYVKSLPQLRELGFRYPVSARFMDREQLRVRMGYELNKELPPQKMIAEQLAGIALGFYPKDMLLKETMTNLYTEEVAGFYDPDTKELYLIADGPDAQKKKKKGLLDLMFGSSDFDPKEQKAVLSHEVAHALADQHFDLLSLHKAAAKDDDMVLGLTALIEGEAMVVMVLDMLPVGDRKDFLLAPPALIATMMKLVVPLAASFMGGPTFRSAPKILQDSLLMPYTDGLRFGLTLLQEGGWQRVDAAFRAPPISSEQVLHPDRYLGDSPDIPMALSLPEPAPDALAGWVLVKQNTIGEFALRVRLEMDTSYTDAKRAAEGWDGDTYQIYRKQGSNSELLVLWATTWDSVQDAREAERSLARIFPDGPGSRVWRKATEVWVIAGAQAAAMDQLARWLEGVKKTEKRMLLKKVQPEVPFPAKPDPRLSSKQPTKTGRPQMGYDPAAGPILKLLGLSDRELVARGVAFADEVCKCKDLECVTEVDARMKPWFEAAKKRHIVVAEFDELKKAIVRYKDCIIATTEAQLKGLGTPP